ncbi:MAG: molybdopterin-dependent oxidoreductase [Eggerthellaceae bacterium]|nr:molybdopterin-dependent oxidoreductase [Eggerthellaceae bacterium]
MSKLSLSRRSFVKTALVSAAAVAAASGASVLAGCSNDAGDEPIENAVYDDGCQHIRSCCRACGKMECGVWVTVKDGRAIAVEGDQSAPQSRGNCCCKSQASMQAAYHPDRLYHPMKRTNPKGEEPGWERITWDEAIQMCAKGFGEITEKYGPQALMTLCGTSRIWSMGGYAGMKILMGTPNGSLASQICKGPRHLTGQMIDQLGSYWMAVNDGPRVYLQWGTGVEASNYDDACRTVVDASNNADVHILVDPREGRLGKEADYWLQIRPGTDHALALAWEKIVIDNGLYNTLFVKRWTNAPMLVVEDMEPSEGYVVDGSGGLDMKTKLLKESDLVEGGDCAKFMVWDLTKAAAGATGNDALSYLDANTTQWEGEDFKGYTLDECEYVEQYNGYIPPASTFDSIDPALEGEYEVTLKDGTVYKARPVWTYLLKSLEECTPEWAEEITGVDAALIEEACLVWATPRYDDQYYPDGSIKFGNGGIHFQLATDQISNVVQTIRTLTYLSYLTGNEDSPAGNRGPTRAPAVGVFQAAPEAPVLSYMAAYPYPSGMTMYHMQSAQVSAEDFPMLCWYNQWSDASKNWLSALGEYGPYRIHGGHDSGSTFMNMSNSKVAWEAIKSMDFWAANNLWHHPVTDLADVLMPAQHWLEVNHGRVSQGASGGIGATCKAIEPTVDTMFDPDFYTAYAKAINVPWFDAEGWPTWPTAEEKLDFAIVTGNATMDAQGYTDHLADSWQDFHDKFQKNGWWDAKDVTPDNWGTYHRWETGKMRQRAAGIMNDIYPSMGFGFLTATSRMEFWPVSLESIDINNPTQGHCTYENDIMPRYSESLHTPVSDPERAKDYPFIITTGRRIPVFFHSEHRQLPWCREVWPVPRMEINPEDAAELGIEQGDWCWIETPEGAIRQTADLYYGIKKGTINLEHNWWYPELPGPTRGSTLSDCNLLNDIDNQDPIIGSQCMRGFLGKVYKATEENCLEKTGNPSIIPCAPEDGTVIISSASDERLKKWLPNYDIREEA